MTPVEAEIERRLAAGEEVTVATAMALANAHYYATRDPFGAGGDFITAPEISQVFGELVGLWAAEVWRQMGAPPVLRLVELGPGRGTLMADALRAAKVLPAFREALSVELVETSPVLRTRQAATLEDARIAPRWHRRLEDVPDGPAIVVANEFFDALPVRQLMAGAGGWHERILEAAADGALRFAAAAQSCEPPPGIPAALPPGSVVEFSPASAEMMAVLAARLAAHGGAALIIDYGHVVSAPGETLQALRRHHYADVLTDLGEADLTAHVDFAALGRAAAAAGAALHGPIAQRDFLLRLGLAARVARLAAGAGEGAAAVERAAGRLIDPAPTGMGALFKVLAVTDPRLPPPPGFP
jgi:SAM-dependent MidA family methyltransferase